MFISGLAYLANVFRKPKSRGTLTHTHVRPAFQIKDSKLRMPERFAEERDEQREKGTDWNMQQWKKATEEDGS
jgi:hypothetical protein